MNAPTKLYRVVYYLEGDLPEQPPFEESIRATSLSAAKDAIRQLRPDCARIVRCEEMGT